MKKNSITSYDVAKLAGVSQSAVSRCFSPKASVSEKIRNKVIIAAKELGYRPNSIARSLTTRSSRSLALVIYSLENPFYSTVLEQASRFLQAKGYHLLFFFSKPGREFDEIVDDILMSQVEGILMLAFTITSHQAREIAKVGVPVVLINRTVNYENISQVCCDDFSGGYWAGQHLANAGHHRIAFLSGQPDSSTSAQRRAGFLAGLKSCGVELFAEDIGYYRYSEAANAARRLFSSTDYPDAIFVANDLMAIAVMETLRNELQIRIPEQVSIIGFDDIPMSAWHSHSLTTLSQPVEEMIECATEALIEQIDGIATAPKTIMLPVTPMLRRSTRSQFSEPEILETSYPKY